MKTFEIGKKKKKIKTDGRRVGNQNGKLEKAREKGKSKREVKGRNKE